MLTLSFQTQWQSFSPSTLHTYRHAHHLSAPSAYSNPHADLILSSCRTGLRSPSMVTARRKKRQAKLAARRESKLNGKERERSSDRLKSFSNPTTALDGTAGRATHAQLANSVRRHFNSQQVSESDVISRFTYVVRHDGRAAGARAGVGTRGSKVLGINETELDNGWEIGASGREEDRRRDLGFRLRFRP